jgi:GPH family glycoside/pentoside/hexuronide:cation symporter
METGMAAVTTARPGERLPLGLCLGFGLGTNGSATLMGVTGIFLLFFMTTVLGISPAIAGTLIFVTKIYDLITDPLMGHLSDRTASRIGRRRPYLALGAVLCGLSLYLLFSVPAIDNQALLLGWYTVLLLVYATSYTIFTVPYLSMPAEMTTDYNDRTRLMSFRTLFGSTGLLIGTAVAPILVAIGSAGSTTSAPAVAPEVLRPPFPATDDCVMSSLEGGQVAGTPEGYAFMAAVLGLVVCASMLLSFVGTRRAHFTQRSALPERFFQQLLTTLSNRPFVLLVATKMLQLTGVTAFSASLAFFAQYVAQMTGVQLGMFFGLFSLGTILSLPVWLRYARAVGKKRAFITATLMFIVFDLALLGAAVGGLGLVLGLAFLIGLSAGGLIMLGVSMLPDTIEYDFHLSGKKREGIYAGVWSTIEKGSAAFATLLLGLLLSAAGFIETSAGQVACQPRSAITTIQFGVALLPATMMALSLFFLTRYDLTRERLEALAATSLGRGV